MLIQLYVVRAWKCNSTTTRIWWAISWGGLWTVSSLVKIQKREQKRISLLLPTWILVIHEVQALDLWNPCCQYESQAKDKPVPRQDRMNLGLKKHHRTTLLTPLLRKSRKFTTFSQMSRCLEKTEWLLKTVLYFLEALTSTQIPSQLLRSSTLTRNTRFSRNLWV